MTDRELLAAAAYAAGIPTEWHSEAGCRMRLDRIGTVPWNPLADDGDALRLMAALRIDATFNAFGEDEVMTSDSEGRFDGWFNEAYVGDTAAATRRAIVRAAAEIGKAAAPSGATGG